MTTLRQRIVAILSLSGCAVLLGLAVAGLFSAAGPALPWLLAGVLLAAALIAAGAFRRQLAAVRAFRAAYPGRDLLVVYTDSPHWGTYVETRWLPRWAERAVVLNRTRPWSGETPEAELWRAAAGSYEHTPAAIVVPRRGRITVVRFFLAFRDFKHGKDARLRAAEARLEAALARSEGR